MNSAQLISSGIDASAIPLDGHSGARARPAKRGWVAGIVWHLSLLNLVAVGVVWLLLFQVSERWWFSTALTYLPRSPYILPAGILLCAGLVFCRMAVLPNLLAALIVLGPIAEFQLPTLRLGSAGPTSSRAGSDRVTGEQELTIVSCNVQGYQPRFEEVLEEILRFAPDIVAFQEAKPHCPLLDEHFEDWQTVHFSEFWIASRFPMRLIGTCGVEAFDRVTAIKVEIQAPDGIVHLTNLHLMTARRGFSGLSPEMLWQNEGGEQIERHVALRDEEAHVTRAFVVSTSEGPHLTRKLNRTDEPTSTVTANRDANADRQETIPAVVLGDFNTPSSSWLFQKHWGDYASAFDQVGEGYGYTSPCRPHAFWFDSLPWIRIDHILTTADWRVRRCEVGGSCGSDHRLIVATIAL